MQPDTPDNNNPAANALDTTEAEAAALATQETPDAGGKPPEGEAAKPDGATPPEKPEGAPAGGDDAAAAAAAAESAAAEAAAAEAAKQQAPAPFAPVYAPSGDQRDFAKELTDVSAALKDLKTKLGDDDINEEAYDAEYERLQNQKTQIIAAQAVAEARAEMSQQSADQAWMYLQNQFFADPANAAIRGSVPMFAAWEAAMQEVANAAWAEKKQITDWEIMTGARQKLVEQGFPLQAAQASGKKPDTEVTPPAKPDRTPPIGTVPQQLSTAPNTGDPGARPTAEAIAGMGIEDIEDRMKSMTDAQRDAVLQGTPGAFVD